MNIHKSRRSLIVSMLLMAGGVAVLATGPATAATNKNYPTKAIRFVVPLPPGGGADLVARLIAEQLSKRLGQQVVVENKPGGSGAIGAIDVAHAAPDGYTLLLGTATTHAINPSLIKKLGYDPVKDFEPISLVANLPLILVANDTVPGHTLQDLIEYAKRKPGKLNYASTSNGSSIHMAGEMLKKEAGIKVVHVPYKGASPALTDLLAGRVSYMFTTIPPALPYVKSGRLKALAVASPKRTSLLPDVPSMAEAGIPEVKASSWNGILAPAKTPEYIIDKLNTEIAAVMKSPQIKSAFSKHGIEAVSDTPGQFAQFMKQETERYAAIIKISGAKVD